MRLHVNSRFPEYHALMIPIITLLAAAFSTLAYAGAIKGDAGSYQIVDDSLTSSGSAGLVDAGYWLVFSAGQPVGNVDMQGGGYSLEGGFVSGIDAVLQAVVTTEIEAPTGYSGAATDEAPGARVTFKVEFTNFGEAARNALVDDLIPSDMTYASGTIAVVLEGASTSQSDDHTDGCGYTATASINCLIPNVAAGATGAVTFEAYID